MFDGPVLWRGIVFAILMALAKCATGLWLPIFSIFSRRFAQKSQNQDSNQQPEKHNNVEDKSNPSAVPANRNYLSTGAPSAVSRSATVLTLVEPSPVDDSRKPAIASLGHENNFTTPSYSTTPDLAGEPTNPSHGNYYAALLMAFVMTTRGEIGFLIAAIAQSTGILMPEEVYLVVVWAIVLCTLVGPIGMGLIVRKVKKVKKATGGIQILGIWGETTIEMMNDSR
jgi:hypothetical protein